MNDAVNIVIRAAKNAGHIIGSPAAEAIIEALGMTPPSEAGEEWRPVEECKGHYEVSNYGRVRSVTRMEKCKTGIVRGRLGRILRPSVMKPPRLPYVRVGLSGYGGQALNRSVHRLVALAFIGPAPFPEAHVAHIDGNPMNNVDSNLMWASAAENLSHQIEHGTRLQGESHPSSTMTEDQVREIKRMVKPGFRARKIANKMGLTTAQVHCVISGKSWRHVE